MQILPSIKKSFLKIHLALTLSLGLACTNIVFANTPKNVFYGEVSGLNSSYTINYERIFQSGAIYRIGTGPLSLDIQEENRSFKMSGYMIPMTSVYLMGRTNHKLEIGAGSYTFIGDYHLKYVTCEKDNKLIHKSISGYDAIASFVLITGYRYQSYRSGLNFRTGITTHLMKNMFIVVPHMSFGIQF